MNSTTPLQDRTAFAMDGMNPLTFPELRGEADIDAQRVGNMDRRYGVPVPIGSVVLAGERGVCLVIGGTDQLAILLDEDGRQLAECWGVLHVQASGPAFTPSATAAASDAADTIYRLARQLADAMRTIDAQLDTLADHAGRDAGDRLQGYAGEFITKMSGLIDGLIHHAADALVQDREGNRLTPPRRGAA